MPYLVFLRSDKICNCRLLQNIGGALRVKSQLSSLLHDSDLNQLICYPGANFINEFTACFVLKTSYEVRTLKIGIHPTIELCELLTFCRIFKTNI